MTLTSAEGIDIKASEAIAAIKKAASLIPPKSVLSSKSIAGLNIMLLLELSKIFTGDFLTLSGCIELFILLSAYSLSFKGRLSANTPVAFTLPGSQKKELSADDVVKATKAMNEAVKAAEQVSTTA